MSARETVLPIVVTREFGDQPNDVSVVQIVAGIGARTSNRLKERTIYRYGYLRSPTSKRRNLDLQLRHETFGTRRPPVRPANRVRKWRFCMVVVPQLFKFGRHPFAREVHGLNFQSIPSKVALGRFCDDQINLSRRFVRPGSAHEWNFTRHQRLVWRKADDLRQPSYQHLVFFESCRAEDSRVARRRTESAILALLIAVKGAHAATFVARRAVLLKWARRNGSVFLKRDLCQSAPRIYRKGPERSAVPFRDPVACAHVLNTGRGVMMSSGTRL